jgi:type IV pilus assembly protein PilO
MKLDFLKKAKKSEIVAFTVIVSCVIVIVYYFIFLAPVMAKFLYVFSEVSRTQSRLNEAEYSVDRSPKIKKEIEELKAKAEFYSSKLPREEEFPAVLENLSDMAKNAGVKITKILPVRDSQLLPETGEHLDIYREKEISITAQCGYHQLGTFISELENSERFMKVSDIKIDAARANTKRHNIQLIVKTFILEGED